jgi:hypothetical protein
MLLIGCPAIYPATRNQKHEFQNEMSLSWESFPKNVKVRLVQQSLSTLCGGQRSALQFSGLSQKGRWFFYFYRQQTCSPFVSSTSDWIFDGKWSDSEWSNARTDLWSFFHRRTISCHLTSFSDWNTHFQSDFTGESHFEHRLFMTSCECAWWKQQIVWSCLCLFLFCFRFHAQHVPEADRMPETQEGYQFTARKRLTRVRDFWIRTEMVSFILPRPSQFVFEALPNDLK